MGPITRIEMDYMEAVKRIAHVACRPAEIDWEQRRYEIAKDILTAQVGNTVGFGNNDRRVKEAVMYADLLIDELKKSKCQ